MAARQRPGFRWYVTMENSETLARTENSRTAIPENHLLSTFMLASSISLKLNQAGISNMDPFGQRARRVTCRSHGDRAAVKLGEREAIEGLVEVRLLVPQDADRDRFAEQKSLHGIRAPMDSLDVTAQDEIVGELVQFAAHGDRSRVGPGVGD